MRSFIAVYDHEDQDMDKDLTPKDQDKDKDLKNVLKESFWLKQRKGKFQKGYLFENVNVQPRYHSRYPLVCLEWRTLGAKVNSAHYSEHIVLKRGIHFQATCGRRNWTLQHNGAPSYTAINAINFLQENVFHRTRQAASEQS